MQFRRPGQAVSVLRSPNLIVMYPYSDKRSHVLTQKEIVHKKIAQDLQDDPFILMPDVEVIDVNVDQFPDRSLAEADTQSVERSSDVTVVDENATKPIWMWEYA